VIRAFAAIALPEAVRFELMLVGHGLPVPKPVPPENLHLTLVFLGELPEPVVADIDLALAAVRAPGFELGFAGLGLFGGARPRVAFAAIADSAPLRHLQAKVETAARGAGLAEPSRRYAPHVTLARLPERGIDRGRLETAVAGRPGPVAPAFRVEDFRLYRSRLGAGAAVYEELARYPLG
jgi:RNA 2',3'-cyclic 3'-phosphodiesterase